MSDHDRGAYTPHNDAPLSFDARQSRGRRGFPTTLVISLVILVGLVGAIVMFYRSGVRGAGEVPTPVGAPVGQIKAPAPAGQAQPDGDAAAGLQIYKSETPAAASGAPVFASGPEQPQPRPAPTTPVTAEPVAPVVTHTVPAPATPPPAAPAQVAASGATTKAAPAMAAAKPAPTPAPVPAPAKPVVMAKAKPASDDVDALLKANPPKAAAPAKPVQVAEAKPAPATSKPVAQGAAVVQIGAYSSAALAGKGWSDIAAAYPADMAGKGKLVESVDRDGKTLFRGAVSGFASHADAVAFCVKLKTDGKACIVR